MKIVIIGAGPTGLGAAHRLHELSHDTWMVYEKNEYPGGLAASFRDTSGFIWDIGGHVLFSHYRYFDDVVAHALGDDYLEHLRESWIRILNTWVPYPFQNNIRHLPSGPLKECLDGLRYLRENHRHAGNFHEWMLSMFGAGIVKYFMEPYNSKVWGVPLQTMSSDWIGERVSVVDLPHIEKNIAEGRDDRGWGPNNKFKFPKYGGTGTLFKAISRPFHDSIQFRHELEWLDMSKKEILFTNGRRDHYDMLINTMPLDMLLQCAKGCPASVVSASRELTHNAGLSVGLGFAGRRSDTKCWMYFPEPNAPFYRVTNFHNYSPYNVPDGDVQRYYSLMCETTYSAFRPTDKSTIVDQTVNGLIKTGIISDEERNRIVSRYVIDIPYSYPIPSLGRDAALALIQPYLESQGVYSRGRFGAWRYEIGNMDHSFMQGVEAVDRILNGKREAIITGKG